MDLAAFDADRIAEYARKAKEQWGSTPAYREYEENSGSRTQTDEERIASGLMGIFEEFGGMKGKDPGSPEVREQVGKLQRYITEHYYRCTEEILSGLGEMYAGGGEFTENIDRAGGAGTAAFVCRAIRAFCGKQPVGRS